MENGLDVLRYDKMTIKVYDGVMVAAVVMETALHVGIGSDLVGFTK